MDESSQGKLEISIISRIPGDPAKSQNHVDPVQLYTSPLDEL